MKKIFKLFLFFLCVLIVPALCQASATILTNANPNHTVISGSDEKVYGTSSSNQITLESGAKAELINFPGFNVVQIQSSSELFTVSRSGTLVTFAGSDETILKIPATTDVQTISFNGEESRVLLIHNNQVKLDDQVVTAMPVYLGNPELSVSPSLRNVDSDSGTTTFSVSNTGADTMAWTAEVISGSDWLTINSGGSGYDQGTITCHYEANTETDPRTGAIRITATGTTGSPMDVTVTQQAHISCSYSIYPTSGSFSTNGESKSISVTPSSSNCFWTTSESLPWVSLSPTSWTGSGDVTVSVNPNTGSARSGTIIIAGETYEISQDENDPNRLNIAYIARNGLTVTLTSFDQIDTGGYYNYTVSYTQKNNTTDAIDEGQLKLYLANNTGLPQYGFFNKLYPGDTQSRSYTFKVLYTDATPVILEYDQDNFFTSTPVTGSLQWTIPILN